MSIPDSAQPRPLPTSASYSITVGIYAFPDAAVVGALATAVGAAGGFDVLPRDSVTSGS
jgi:malate dehydrogenase (oxaloacetate-decarboxylating)